MQDGYLTSQNTDFACARGVPARSKAIDGGCTQPIGLFVTSYGWRGYRISAYACDKLHKRQFPLGWVRVVVLHQAIRDQ